MKTGLCPIWGFPWKEHKLPSQVILCRWGGPVPQGHVCPHAAAVIPTEASRANGIPLSLEMGFLCSNNSYFMDIRACCVVSNHASWAERVSLEVWDELFLDYLSKVLQIIIIMVLK